MMTSLFYVTGECDRFLKSDDKVNSDQRSPLFRFNRQKLFVDSTPVEKFLSQVVT